MAAEATTAGEDYTQAPGYQTDPYWVSLRDEEKWGTLAPLGASHYEISTHGRFRSLDRTAASGRAIKGQMLAATPNGDGYRIIRYTRDDGEREGRTLHSTVLIIHDRPRPDGLQACHRRDNQDHNWLSALAWDTDEANRKARQRNRPARPRLVREPRICVRCNTGPVTSNGKRCHPCVVQLGQLAAALLRDGNSPGTVAGRLDYPSPDGIVTLAIRYGGYGKSPLRRWLQAATTTLRVRCRRREGDRL